MNGPNESVVTIYSVLSPCGRQSDSPLRKGDNPNGPVQSQHRALSSVFLHQVQMWHLLL